MIEITRPVQVGRVNALFIGKTSEFAAADFSAQYELILHKHSSIRALAYAGQVHGDHVFEISVPAEKLHFAGEGDALYTRAQGTALLIRTADCIPILFYSETEALIGAVHAGWRGLEKKILSRTLDACATEAKSLKFLIGPFIGERSYEVGADVADRFESTTRIPGENGKFWLSLKKILERELLALGVPAAQVTWHDEDTLAAKDWYSARRGDSLRNFSLVWLTGR